MSLINDASLILTPNAISAGKLYSIIPTNGNGDMTVVRGTNATRINSAGLVEIPRTNLLLNSVWAGGGSLPTSWILSTSTGTSTPVASIVNPNVTAYKFITNNTRREFNQNRAEIVGSVTSFSVYVEEVTTPVQILFMLRAAGDAGATGTAVYLRNNIVVPSTQNIQAGFTYTIQFTCTIAGNFAYRVGSGCNGDVTGNFTLSMPQLETGNVTTEYIPTTTTIRTRFSGITQDGASASNIARLNYDTVGGCPAILIEPQRTNLFVNSVLSGTGATPTSWAAGFQTGTSTPVQSVKNLSINAYRFITSNTRQEFSQTFNLALNSISCFSVFVESVTTPIPVSQMLRVNPIAGGASTQVFLKNNIVITSLTNIEAGFTYTLQVTCTISDSFQFRMGCGVNGPITGDITLSMPQLETGAYPTSYIPTLGSAQTRNADVLTRANIFTNNLITSAGGTWFVHLRNNIPYIRDANIGIWVGDNSTAQFNGNSLYIWNTSAPNSRLNIGKTISGVFSNLFTTTTDTVKIAIKWNGATADIFQNGVKVITATAFTITAMEFLNLRGTDVTKSINSTMLFPTPLTDTECINLTTL